MILFLIINWLRDSFMICSQDKDPGMRQAQTSGGIPATATPGSKALTHLNGEFSEHTAQDYFLPSCSCPPLQRRSELQWGLEASILTQEQGGTLGFAAAWRLNNGYNNPSEL